MNKANHALTNDGVQAKIKQLQKQINRWSLYAKMKDTPEGALFISDLKDRINFARSQYNHIDPASPHAILLLNRTQAIETEANEMFAKFDGSNAYIDACRKEIKELTKLLKDRVEKVKQRTSLIPSTIAKEQNG